MPEKFGSDAGVVTRIRSENKVKRPRLFKVLLHNDDYTTREFVVDVLCSVFHKSEPEAVRVMLHVHHTGTGVAGVFTREIAETKVRTVQHLARQHEFPLQLTMEPESEDDED
jgi:ATP-dependent Clp protease adaptor protein ClpS